MRRVSVVGRFTSSCVKGSPCLVRLDNLGTGFLCLARLVSLVNLHSRDPNNLFLNDKRTHDRGVQDTGCDLSDVRV